MVVNKIFNLGWNLEEVNAIVTKWFPTMYGYQVLVECKLAWLIFSYYTFITF